ncbi:MAG: hypothetical protein JWM02_15 [Frankiales bacterium]|nr:hypothetical protein [Frankiales bacterium]
MTTALPPEGPSGRRDNGLHSAEWGALVDLDPRLSAALLDSLAAEGVAAFVEPARDVDVYTRATVLPKRPLDRLWVDPTQADLARGVVTSEVADLTALLAEQEPGATAHGLVRPVPRTAAMRVLPPPELPGPPRTEVEPVETPTEPVPETATSPVAPPIGGAAAPSDDELFRQIVEGFTRESEDPVPRWPVSEDLDGPSTSRPHRRRREDALDEVDALPDWVEPAALEDDGHYQPPPPPKLPRLHLRTVLAVALLLTGLGVLFAPFQIGLDDSPISILFGLVLTGGGGGLLVAWMRDAPPADSGPDDGAVV